MNHDLAKVLVGSWVTDPEDAASLKHGKASLEFADDGRLIYTILGKEKDEKIFLTYRVEGNVLITDQPSHPREERSLFTFTPDGKLDLIYGTERSIYIRT